MANTIKDLKEFRTKKRRYRNSKPKNVNIKVYKNPKKELPEKGSKEFFMRGIRKLGKDVKETANVLEMFTPIGPANKAIKKAIPLIKQKLALRGGGRAYGKNS